MATAPSCSQRSLSLLLCWYKEKKWRAYWYKSTCVLAQKYKNWHQSPCTWGSSPPSASGSCYRHVAAVAARTDCCSSINFRLVVALRFRLVPCRAAGTQFTCFTGTKVPILTQQQLDSIRTEFAKEDMSRWESAYNIRPPPSDLPAGLVGLYRTSDSRLCSPYCHYCTACGRADGRRLVLYECCSCCSAYWLLQQYAAEWTVDDMCYMLERRGLASSSEAVRRAGIDGKKFNIYIFIFLTCF
jgi:hypothetical protein